jgi:hypothetical protein
MKLHFEQLTWCIFLYPWLVDSGNVELDIEEKEAVELPGKDEMAIVLTPKLHLNFSSQIDIQ